MAACEKCWSDAQRRAGEMGGSVPDRYSELIREREQTPCSLTEQCGFMHIIPTGAVSCRCGSHPEMPAKIALDGHGEKS